MLFLPIYSKNRDNATWRLLATAHNANPWLSAGQGLAIQFCNSVKRDYLADFKPVSYEFTPKAIFKQLLKAMLLPATMLLNEYNAHMIRAEQDEEGNEEEFDWEECLDRSISKVMPTLKRNYAITIIKKFYEELAFYNLPIKIVDRLTKDVDKSILRKLVKYNRAEACSRIFLTAIWANTIWHISTFTYEIYEEIYVKNLAEENEVQCI